MDFAFFLHAMRFPPTTRTIHACFALKYADDGRMTHFIERRPSIEQEKNKNVRRKKLRRVYRAIGEKKRR